MQTKEINSLQGRVAVLSKIANDNLGDGVWGLKRDDNKFSHEEILFLFARIFPVLGIDYIIKVRTEFPDCICMKGGEEFTIELEPLLSNFKDHLYKHEINKCNCIVCWKDDLGRYDSLIKELENHNIEVIELEKYYEELKIKDRKTSLEWGLEDIKKLGTNQLRILKCFIDYDKDILTTENLIEYFKGRDYLQGKSLGGAITGFTQRKKKEPLISIHHKGWLLNSKYKDKIIQTLKNFNNLE
jgi:hypothetical protein